MSVQNVSREAVSGRQLLFSVEAESRSDLSPEMCELKLIRLDKAQCLDYKRERNVRPRSQSQPEALCLLFAVWTILYVNCKMSLLRNHSSFYISVARDYWKHFWSGLSFSDFNKEIPSCFWKRLDERWHDWHNIQCLVLSHNIVAHSIF